MSMVSNAPYPPDEVHLEWQQAGPYARSMQVVDLNADHILDIVTANEYSHELNALLGVGDGAFKPAVTYSTGYTPLSVAAGDVTGDGNVDIVCSDRYDGVVTIHAGARDGTLSSLREYPVAGTARSVSLGDFNRDGHLDLVTANYAQDTLSVLFGQGNGVFANRADYPTDSSPLATAVADFDLDGNLDIVATMVGVLLTGETTLQIYWGTGSGSFSMPTSYPVPQFLRSVVAADLNLDGAPDIVTAIEYGKLGVLLNTHSRAFADRAIYQLPAGVSSDSVQVLDIGGHGQRGECCRPGAAQWLPLIAAHGIAVARASSSARRTSSRAWVAQRWPNGRRVVVLGLELCPRLT